MSINRFLQDKWEEENSNRKESMRSINEAQCSSGTKDVKIEWRLCDNCKKRKDHCMYIKGQWLCMICRGEKYGENRGK